MRLEDLHDGTRRWNRREFRPHTPQIRSAYPRLRTLKKALGGCSSSIDSKKLPKSVPILLNNSRCSYRGGKRVEARAQILLHSEPQFKFSRITSSFEVSRVAQEHVKLELGHPKCGVPIRLSHFGKSHRCSNILCFYSFSTLPLQPLNLLHYHIDHNCPACVSPLSSPLAATPLSLLRRKTPPTQLPNP